LALPGTAFSDRRGPAPILPPPSGGHPVPDSLSEYQFAGLLRGARTEITACIGNTLQVPATAEIVLKVTSVRPANAKGELSAANLGYETALEGPFGDHTGYYNEVERFPVFTVERITMRRKPDLPLDLHGKAADERRSRVALNDVFRPILRRTFSRNRRLLPANRRVQLPDGGRVDSRKQYPGHAKRVMFGIWSFLRQFMYHEVHRRHDADIDVRDWKEVVCHSRPVRPDGRDTVLSGQRPQSLLDSRLGLGVGPGARWYRRDQQDARRDAARVGPARSPSDDATSARVDAIWQQLGL